ncbi:NAD(P)/FAD-dependent oxidoreductase [Streptomyces sp. NPDC090108]|uniref:NAD(P)/FAD-dependent oxidoreductase n=1 Tax=Streptomyces sp. NPDC090108 TaxID=3365947 RepID=UPI003821D8DD
MRKAGLVVVGASLAGLRAVEAARASGYAGPVTLIGAEPHPPYDRPPLSKAFLQGGEGDEYGDGDAPAVPTLAGASALAALGVDVRLGEPATGLCLEAREVVAGGRAVPFDSLVVATGCTPVTLSDIGVALDDAGGPVDVGGAGVPDDTAGPVGGAGGIGGIGHVPAVGPVGARGAARMDGVHTLRTVEDARAVRRHVLAGARTVLVGGGFVGAEVATALRARGAVVTIVEAADVPLVRAAGPVVAPLLADLHARAGVDLRLGVSVRRVSRGPDGKRVVLSDGSVLDADLVLAGVGARPATGWLADSGLPVGDGVLCDETLRAAPGVHAAGDVARWHNPLFGTAMRLENRTAAAELGTAAGRNAVGPAAAVPVVPYFWSDWYGSPIRMAGVAAADEVRVTGAPESGSWTALYRSGDRVAGALTVGLSRQVMKYRAMIARRAPWETACAFAGAARTARHL